MRYPVAPLSLALGLLLTVACGSGVEESEAAQPIEELLGLPVDEDDRLAAEIDLARRVEDLVGECMVSRGFDYQQLPVDVERFSASIGSSESREDWGITQQILDAIQGSDLDSPLSVDPNATLLDAMSDDEREAWFQALDGGPLLTRDELGPEAPVSPEEIGLRVRDQAAAGQAGCRVIASEQALAESGRNMEAIDEYERRLAESVEDPRIVAAWTHWADCMAFAGYAVESESALINLLYERLNQVQRDHEDDPPETYPSPQLLGDLDAVLGFERELFIESDTCIDEANVNEISDLVRAEIGQEFVSQSTG